MDPYNPLVSSLLFWHHPQYGALYDTGQKLWQFMERKEPFPSQNGKDLFPTPLKSWISTSFPSVV